MKNLQDKKQKDVTFFNEPKLNTQMGFVYRNGKHNCKLMTFADKEQITKSLIEEKRFTKEDFNDELRLFIETYENKEVLCHILKIGGENPDIFVFPEDDTPFSFGCFN